MEKQLMENLLVEKKSLGRGITFDKDESTLKEFKSDLNELERLPTDGFGKMLPEYCNDHGN